VSGAEWLHTGDLATNDEDGALAAETTETRDAERRSAYLSASHAAILAWAKEQGADLRKGA